MRPNGFSKTPPSRQIRTFLKEYLENSSEKYFFYTMKGWHYLTIILLLFSCQKENGPSIDLPDIPVENNGVITIIEDTFEGEDIVIAGSKSSQFIVSFYSQLSDGAKLRFTPLQGVFPNIMEDQKGNIYDLFGHVVRGPRKGERLPVANSGMGYWFAFASRYPGVSIFQEPDVEVDINEIKPTEEWLIPPGLIVEGSGVDWIPSLQDPPFETYNEKNVSNTSFYVQDNELVIGVKVGDQYKVYPHKILNWHEIANDQLEDEKYAVIYCPLTGTSSAWNREVSGQTTTFGVSGLLYNNNIIPFDRSTESLWSQMHIQCIHGDLIETVPQLYPVVEMTWGLWKSMFKQFLIMSDDTGIDRNYGTFPYADYPINDDLIFYPMTYDDDRLPRKERLHGVMINGKARVYRFEHF
jgi:hypothetical protein